MSRQAKRYQKEAPVAVPVKPEKFVRQRNGKCLQLSAKNQNQARAMDMLHKKQLVVLGGSSGAGKSILASVHAANQYLRGEAAQIVLIRPAEPLGKTVGFKKGSQFEKLQPLMATLLDDIKMVVGDGEYQYMLETGKLILESLEDVRGRSYKKSVVILDEGQNASIREMKAILTRLEEDSQLIICGDWRQQDLKGKSGLKWMYDRLSETLVERPSYLDTEDMNQALTNIGTVIFTPDDIVRSGLTRFWVKVFDNNPSDE